MVGNVIAFAIGAKAPSMVGTTDAIAIDIAAAAIEHHVGRVVGRRQMRFHVRAIGVQQHHFACGPPSVEGKVFAKKANRQRLVRVQLFSICNHEPTPWKGEFTQAVVFGCGHLVSQQSRTLESHHIGGSLLVWHTLFGRFWIKIKFLRQGFALTRLDDERIERIQDHPNSEDPIDLEPV